MDLIVTARAGEKRGRARLGGRVYPCALGGAGILADKREGDRATPMGRFRFRQAMYRADRNVAPSTALPLRVIQEDDGWCDDPGHRDYNRMVRLPFASSHERLWREDRLYDILAIIGHNDDPPIAGMGSAVFVHLARPEFSPTEGCVAFGEEDLREILAAVSPADFIDIRLLAP